MAKMKSSVIFVLLGVAVVLVALAYLFTKDQASESLEPESTVSEEAVITEEEVSSNESVTFIDVEAALGERILGDANAPIKISEHSSLTCGHCGKFHQQTFKPFKSAWIDTGKAYLVFSDFPLNAPALHASMVARCLPEDKYFDFIQMLFETQSDWAYDVGYINYLKSKALENGLSAEGFKACLNSKELQDGILARVRASQAQWDINSTPSFVVNNTTTLSGALPFAEFNAEIEKALNPDTPVEEIDSGIESKETAQKQVEKDQDSSSEGEEVEDPASTEDSAE